MSYIKTRVNVKDYLKLHILISKNNAHYLHGEKQNTMSEPNIYEHEENKSNTDATTHQT